ncbi:MAG: nucleotide-binding protein [Caulobacter sp.]|nr:nucleotide-binding protein [Caulobacter sp.]
MTDGKPAIFIGSSVEGLDVAYALQQGLEYDAEPTVWSQGVFTLNQAAIVDLIGETRTTDFALFVLTADDIRSMRGASTSVPRDNVIFELGLFIGALGLERCFFVTPRNADPVSLPSDLLGLTSLSYEAQRADGRLLAALGPAVHHVRAALRKLGRRPPTRVRTIDSAPISTHPDLAADFIATWNGAELKDARDTLRAGIPLHAFEDETGDGTRALKRVFAFLDSLADALLAGWVDEVRAKDVFGGSIKAVWERSRTYLAPLNIADEWWSPPPQIAILYERWYPAV